MTETKLFKIFISIDDFMKIYSRFISRIKLEEVGAKDTYTGKKVRQPGLNQSEVMTIMVFYQICKFRDFKHYYIHFVLKYLNPYFPQLPSKGVWGDVYGDKGYISKKTLGLSQKFRNQSPDKIPKKHEASPTFSFSKNSTKPKTRHRMHE